MKNQITMCILMVLILFIACHRETENEVLIRNVESMFSGNIFPGMIIKVDNDNHIVYVNDNLWDKLNKIEKRKYVEMWAKYFDVSVGKNSDYMYYSIWVYNESGRVVAGYKQGRGIINDYDKY